MSVQLIDHPITAGQVIQRIVADRYAKSFIIPNYAPAGWWENDVLELTEAGYWREFEVKLTRSDFLADREKDQRIHPWKWGEPERRERKHDLLAQTDRGPCQFWFVVPEELVGGLQPILPSWSGLMAFGEVSGIRRPWNIRLREIVKAPRRHANKAPPELRQQALETIYWRWHKS